MDENTVRAEEIEEHDQDEIEVDEVPEGTSAGGAFIAGIVGGFLAYATIGGVRRLATFTRMKLAERKNKQLGNNPAAINTDCTEVSDKQEGSEEESSEKK